MPTSDRPTALMTPTVTVWSSPKGLPMAMAHSPIRILPESPNVATGRSSGASILITARSVLESLPMTVAENFRLSARRTSIWSACSITWLLVKMYPRLSTSTPDPRLRRSRCGRSPKKRSKKSSPKKSRNGPGKGGAGEERRPSWGRGRWVVAVLTTAGFTDWATWTKASCSAWRTSRPSCAAAGADIGAGTRNSTRTRPMGAHPDLKARLAGFMDPPWDTESDGGDVFLTHAPGTVKRLTASAVPAGEIVRSPDPAIRAHTNHADAGLAPSDLVRVSPRILEAPAQGPIQSGQDVEAGGIRPRGCDIPVHVSGDLVKVRLGPGNSHPVQGCRPPSREGKEPQWLHPEEEQQG